MIPSSQMISHLDYLSQDNLVRRNKSSYFGVIATAILIIIVLILYVPLAVSYSNGIQTSSTFPTKNDRIYRHKFYSKDDFKLAIVFRNRKSGLLIDHQRLIQSVRAQIFFDPVNWREPDLNQQLVPCDKQYFQGDIGGEVIQDCLKIPDYVQYQASRQSGRYPKFKIQLKSIGISLPFISNNSSKQIQTFSNQQKIFGKLLEDNYYEIVFSTRLMMKDGTTKFRMNKVSSTQYNIASDTIGASFKLSLNIRQNLIDRSINPWNDHRNVTVLDWLGQVQESKTVSFSQSQKQGIYGQIVLGDNVITSYRSFRKLDWLVGVISGAVFLLYLMFWPIVHHFKDGLQKIQLANKLLLQKIQDNPETQQALIEVKIPKTYLLIRLIPCLRVAANQKVIQEIQNENDICLLIKKLKVTVRNLKKKGFQEQFKPKIVIFQQQQRLVQQDSQLQQSEEGSQRNQERQIIQQHANSMTKQKMLDESKQNLIQHVQFSHNKMKNTQNFEQFMESQQSEQINKEKNVKIFNPFQKTDSRFHHVENIQQEKIEHIDMKSQNKINQFRAQQIIKKSNLDKKQNEKHQQPVDSKTGLNQKQLNYIKVNSDIQPFFENNPTYLIFKQQKHEKFQQIMEFQEYDKWKNYFPKKKALLRQKIASVIQFCDIFGVRYQFIGQPQNGTIFSSLVILVIIGLSLVTFYTTMVNASQLQYINQAQILQPSQINFSRKTSKTFNMLACFWLPSNVNSNSKVKFTFFTYDNGITRQFQPISLDTNQDNYFDINKNEQIFDIYFYRGDCFRFEDNITINMNQNAYFGFKVTPFCDGTESYCQANKNLTIKNFLDNFNQNRKNLVLPSYSYNPTTGKMQSKMINTHFQNTFSIDMVQSNNFQQNIQVHQTRLYDDTQDGVFRQQPKLIDMNIHADYSLRRTRLRSIEDNLTQYVMKVTLGPTLNKLTIKNKNYDYMFGVFGGILLFWYLIIQLLAKSYSRFVFYLYVSKSVYDQEGYDQNFFKKIFALSFWPRKLIPKCLKAREDLTRMRFMTQKIEHSVSQLSILKYTQICFKLSSAFFSSISAKNMSLIYFRQKIDQNADVQIPAEPQKKQSKEQDFVDQQGQLKVQQIIVFNQNQISNTNTQQIKLKKDGVQDDAQRLLQQDLKLIQKENDHIIQRYQHNWYDYLDLYRQNASFYFNQKKKATSVCGGIFSMASIALIILLSLYQLTSYFKRYESISSDITMDTSNQGLKFITGKNFKLAVNFLNNKTFVPENVSSLVSGIGISLRKQKFQRINGMIVSSSQLIPFVPCPQNYIESWMSKTIDKSYHTSLKHSYCVPDNEVLFIEGEPSDITRQSFKFTIYNELQTPAGLTNLKSFLQSHHVQLHFSSPQHNSIKKTISYQMNSQILAFTDQLYYPRNIYFHRLKPFQTNITLSKLNITYDESSDWYQGTDNKVSYLYQPYNKYVQDHIYNTDKHGNSWYNVSFSYSKKMHTYQVKTPKFIQVFGIIGGIVAVYLIIFSWLPYSFNKYKMKYEIGKQLYLFDKLRIVRQKEKIRKLNKKTDSQRKQMSRLNNFPEISILEAYTMSFFGYLLKDFNFNKNLRRMTLLQQRVNKDLNLANFYLDLYKARATILAQIDKKAKLDCKLTEIYFKKIINTNPTPFNMSSLKNYARQHKLSSYEQFIIVRAIQNGVKIKQILDSRILEQLFNFVDDGVSINLNRLSDTYNSMQSSLQNKSQVQNDV